MSDQDREVFFLAAQTLAMVPGPRTAELSTLLQRMANTPNEVTSVQIAAVIGPVLDQLARESDPDLWADQVESFAIGEDMIAVLVAERSSQVALLEDVRARLSVPVKV